jgi:hypothetical protein
MVAFVDDKNLKFSPIPTLDEFLTYSPYVALIFVEIVACMLFNNCC